MIASRWWWMVAAVVLLAGAIWVLLPPGSRPPIEIRFAGPERMRSAPVYVALDQGYFAEQGIRLVITPFFTGKEAFNETMAGRQDVAAVASMPVVSAWAAGQRPAVLVSLSQANAQAGIVTRKGVAEDLRGLRGKRVAVVKATTSDLFLVTMLNAAGMSAQDVTMVEVPETRMVDALVAGQVDAASLWEPVLGQAVARLGEEAVTIGNDGSFVDYWLVGTSERWLAANRDGAERMLRALVQAHEFIHSHPEEARKIVARYVPRDAMPWDERIFRIRLDPAVLESLKVNARIALGVTDTMGLEETIHDEVLRVAAPGKSGRER